MHARAVLSKRSRLLLRNAARRQKRKKLRRDGKWAGEWVSVIGKCASVIMALSSMVVAGVTAIYLYKGFEASNESVRRVAENHILNEAFPKLSVEDYTLAFDGDSFGVLFFEVKNHSHIPARLLALPPRIFDCNGHEIVFTLDGRSAVADGGGVNLSAVGATSFSGLSRDRGFVSISKVGGMKYKDILWGGFSGAVILEFRFITFSEFSYIFENDERLFNLSARMAGGDMAGEILDYIDKMPPAYSYYSVPRVVIYRDGVSVEVPYKSPICRSGMAKILAGGG